MSKTTFKAAWLAVFVLLIGLAQMAEATEYKFTLVNKSGRTFKKITLYPDTDADEPPNLANMLNEPLANGESVRIVFDDADKPTLRWMVWVVCTDGHKEGFAKMHLTEIHKLTLKKSGEAMDAVTD